MPRNTTTLSLMCLKPASVAALIPVRTSFRPCFWGWPVIWAKRFSLRVSSEMVRRSRPACLRGAASLARRMPLVVMERSFGARLFRRLTIVMRSLRTVGSPPVILKCSIPTERAAEAT